MSDAVEQWGIRYRAQTARRAGRSSSRRHARPAGRPSPPLPLVVHHAAAGARPKTRTSGGTPRSRRVCGDLPGGMGRRLPLHSWGWRGQIDDLARMPSILRSARPWLRVDSQRIYAVGGSMGGQETLLLVVVIRNSLRSGRVRLGHPLLPPLRRLRRARPQGSSTAGTRTGRGRRNAEHEPAGLPPARPSALVGRDRPLGCSAADLVERRGRDRHRPGEPVRTVPPRPARARSRGRVERVTGSWSHTAESYRRLAPGRGALVGLVPRLSRLAPVCDRDNHAGVRNVAGRVPGAYSNVVAPVTEGVVSQ